MPSSVSDLRLPTRNQGKEVTEGNLGLLLFVGRPGPSVGERRPVRAGGLR